ncbi:unnamed protein product [Plutella xylostella]|uniref:(diamondback moth) hypothetical protein n=1 Tax=Plutella xylostella TaxID=51655 RepID=A0A8S4EMB6_PLUXY|nr:unnamed protein product [Plutella xylostella]
MPSIKAPSSSETSFYSILRGMKLDKCGDSERSRIKLRRSDERPLARARRRTLRMTVTIVSVFACCWLPYATMTLWYMLDRSSAEHVSSRLQDLFFMMAVSNSCMDPLVYGSYALSLDMKNVLASTFRKILCLTTASPDIQAVSTPGTLKSKATAVLQPECIGVPKRAQRFTVRFEETSFVAPSAGSDPSPWSENKDGACTLKPSRSCEVFTLHSTPRRLRASLDSSETEPIRFARTS